MTVLTVGAGQAYTTIAAAAAASSSGDTINVMAGTYTNDFVTVSHNLTIDGVGGVVNLVATAQPPNGKAIIDEGGSGVSVTLANISLSGATVPDGNGAGIRYEGGNLVLNNVQVSGNQDGLLSSADPNGSITIENSTFNGNGAGDGYTHNIYVGAIASLTVENSTIENAAAGHDIKSRAASTTVKNNTITDTAGTGSYEIDLPNGGAATITNNTIEKGPNAENPIAISYGEEGNLYAAGTLTVSNNLIVNDYAGHTTTAVKNATATTALVSGNTLYGWSNLTSGPAAGSAAGASVASANTVDTTEPALGASTPQGATVGTGPDHLTLNVSEDAWNGDAQFTVSVDGNQVGGVQAATASHAAGQTQSLTVLGNFGTTQHAVSVAFLNDAYGGSSATDRNLYVDSVTDAGRASPGGSLYSNGTETFLVGTPPAVTVGAGSGTIVLKMSEDAWDGDAQFSVKVDGQQVGGIQTATAYHAAGEMQEFDIKGAFTPDSTHQVAVTFLNDAYGGTSSTDRNLYVGQVGSASVQSALFSNGTQTYNGVVPTP